ncbi:hypothetical protein OTU49_001585, partial [Cherax quadricarinatus]
GIHVVAGINPDLLRPLPYIDLKYKECGSVFLSGVGDKDIDWACEVIRALLPKDGRYYSILLPRSNLSAPKAKEMVSILKEKQVMIYKRGFLKLASLTINKKEEVDLKHFTRKELGCEFHRVDESSIWRG